MNKLDNMKEYTVSFVLGLKFFKVVLLKEWIMI